MGHSGSSAIISELRSHSKVVVESPEPVDHQPVHNTTAALEIARQIFDRGIAKGLTPGFKIRPVHILSEPEKWRALAEEYQTRIIWQHRLNTMKAAIGEYSYRYLNDTSSVEGLRVNMTRAERCNVGAGCSFEIHDFSYLHETLKGLIASKNNIVRAVKTISGGGSCIREIPYEDYLYDRENTIHDLLRFLGLPKEKTEPNRYKATGDSMCEVVRNWSDLCANFYSCVTWQPMLDDPHNDCYCPLSTVTAKFCDIRKE